MPAPFHAAANPVHVHRGRGINNDAEVELCLTTVDLHPNMSALSAPLVDTEGDSGDSDNQRDHRDHGIEGIAVPGDREELKFRDPQRDA